MKVDIQIDAALTEEQVTFHLQTLRPEVEEIIQRLNALSQKALVGYVEDEIVLIDPARIVLFYTESGKVMARQADGQTFTMRKRLYELEEQLSGRPFIRISSSALANGKMIARLKMSLNGTMGVLFKDGTQEFASRRCVGNIKQYLGI